MPLPFQFEPRALVRRLSPIQLPRDASGRSVPDLLLVRARHPGPRLPRHLRAWPCVLGLLLARSITRSIHALSVGTERLRAGRLRAPRSASARRDQLGELAESFNLMSRGIQELLQRAGREGAARGGAAHRPADPDEPAARPGPGDPGRAADRRPLPARGRGGRRLLRPAAARPRRAWACWWPTSRARGPRPPSTWPSSRAWCSRSRASTTRPARLLCEANRILAANMDSRSFITMTYAVVDTAARTHALRARRPQPAHPPRGAHRADPRPHPRRARPRPRRRRALRRDPRGGRGAARRRATSSSSSPTASPRP